MKGYKFKLEALLKIRRLKEEQCKQEIGRLQVVVKNIEDKVKGFNEDIAEMYEAQETTLEMGASGQQARFFSFFHEWKKGTY
jgi:flagellar biosynthesis chaperone FliJ